MIRIAVCDDENVIVNQIEHIISEVCKRESIPVNIDVFYSGRELKRQVTSGDIDKDISGNLSESLQ